MIDMKPPISRAKMMSVTKSAIKAIKVNLTLYIFHILCKNCQCEDGFPKPINYLFDLDVCAVILPQHVIY